MPISMAARVRVPPDVLVRTVDDETVLLNIESEHYFGLDGPSTRFWAALTSSNDVAGAYELLLNEFDVEADVLRTDLDRFVTELRDRGLVEVLET